MACAGLQGLAPPWLGRSGLARTLRRRCTQKRAQEGGDGVNDDDTCDGRQRRGILPLQLVRKRGRVVGELTPEIVENLMRGVDVECERYLKPFEGSRYVLNGHQGEVSRGNGAHGTRQTHPPTKTLQHELCTIWRKFPTGVYPKNAGAYIPSEVSQGDLES